MLYEPQSNFFCFLDDQPHYLIPNRYPESHQNYDQNDQLMCNPDCWFTWNAFSAWRQQILLNPNHFTSGTEMVWVHDPVAQTVFPYWLGQEYTTLLFGMQPGAIEPLSLPVQIRSVLACAGVLVNQAEIQKKHVAFNSAIAYCAQLFARGYVPLGRLIHPYHLAALRRYYRYHLRKGHFHLGDQQSQQRYFAHNEPIAKFFHHQFTHLVSRIVGEPVKPSYAYFASYQGGAELPKHIDREQCEYSITLCIDYSPEPECETSWPLYLDTSKQTIKVYQGIGDALLYRGRKLKHYREKLPLESTSTSIFFHYVKADFDGVVD